MEFELILNENNKNNKNNKNIKKIGDIKKKEKTDMETIGYLKKELENVLNNIEIFKRLRHKLYEIENIYKIKNKYFIDIKIKDHNENRDLKRYIENNIRKHINFMNYVSKIKENNNIKIEMTYSKDLEPIIFINKKSIYLIDLEAILRNNPNIEVKYLFEIIKQLYN